MPQAAIETLALSKHFGRFPAVDSVTLHVQPGEVYGFLGLNGAGKTTTIRMLLGLIRPSSGTAAIRGQAIRSGGRGPWDQVGSMVEVPYAYPELTVAENLDIFRRLRGLPTGTVDATLQRLRLTHYRTRRAGELSLGNQQRLGLARALLHEPPVLILDEPSNGLDPAGIVEVRALITELRERGTAVFVSSHILDEVARMATRIGIIHQGRLLQELDTAQLEEVRNRRLIVETRNVAESRALLERAGWQTTAEESPSRFSLRQAEALAASDRIARLLVEGGQQLTALYESEEDLETYFLRIVHDQTD